MNNVCVPRARVNPWGSFFNELDEYVFIPYTDVSEENEKYLIQIDVPGVAKNDVKLTVESRQLSIEGERKGKGKFRKAFSLPDAVDVEKISAEHKDGVLSISIPKIEKAKAREISIT